MDPRDHATSLDTPRAEAGKQEDRQGLAVMDGIVGQLTGSEQWAARVQAAKSAPAKDPFDD